jgi:hypothetical protein
MLVVIPSDYAEQDVVPICISDVDRHNRRVFRGWIEAVRLVADPLRALARNVVGDVWRVSELTEGSVHALSARHGESLGHSPSGRIYADARWRAKDLAGGGRRARVGREVELRNHMLACLKEPHDFRAAVEDRELIERLRTRLKLLRRDDLLTMMHLYLSDAEDQIPAAFGTTPNSRARNTLSQRFYRGIRKAIRLL